MTPLIIIDKYYLEFPLAREILIKHDTAVANKAIAIAKHLGLKKKRVRFIYEAAMLHDIGMFLTNAPDIGCSGCFPYICHGYLGHDLLVKEGFPEHAKVCERHTGAGIGKKEIVLRELPIPFRSMKPKSLEEKIIAYADKFFSKDLNKIGIEKPVEKIRKNLRQHGEDKVIRFDKWHNKFSI